MKNISDRLDLRKHKAKKSEERIALLMRDPLVGEMMVGMLNFSEEQKNQMLLFFNQLAVKEGKETCQGLPFLGTKMNQEQVDEKSRWEFLLFDVTGSQVGHGTYYPFGGNVQVCLKSENYASWQFASISEVLLIAGVSGFRWKHQKRHYASEDQESGAYAKENV